MRKTDRITLLTILLATMLATNSVLAGTHKGKHKAMKPVAKTVMGGPHYGLTMGLDQAVFTQSSTGTATLHATLTLFNHSTEPLHFTEQGRMYEWQVIDAQGTVVWDYAKGRMFPMFMRARTLTNSEMSYTYAIPLADQEGNPLPPGKYQLRGQLANNLTLSAAVGFTIAEKR